MIIFLKLVSDQAIVFQKPYKKTESSRDKTGFVIYSQALQLGGTRLIWLIMETSRLSVW